MSKVVEVGEGRRREVHVQTPLMVGNWHFFLAEDLNHIQIILLLEILSSRRVLVYYNPTEVPGSIII